jgi:hypothetical protein
MALCLISAGRMSEHPPRLWAQASMIAAKDLDNGSEQHSTKRTTVEQYAGGMSLTDWAHATL